MRIDRRLLGWGVFFILVGAIPLATRAGYLDRSIVEEWPTLWPLLLIGWGLGLLLRRTPIDWVGGAVAAITFGLMGGGLVTTGFGAIPATTGCGNPSGGTAFAAQSGVLSGPGRLNVELNCGSVQLQPVDGSSWTVEGTATDGEAPRVRVEGTTVTIDDGRTRSIFDGVPRTDWTVSVPRGQLLGLGLTINAGNGTVGLDGAVLDAVNLTVNAGSATVDLDGTASLGSVNATVNAGSATIALPAGGRTVNLSLNAGSLTVCAPSGTMLRVAWGGALASNDLDDAGLVKVDQNTWQSSGFDASQPFMDLHVSANAGSFSLDLDGACDA